MGLIRNHYVGRTFIEPEQAIRDFGVKLKLNPVRRMLEGQARGAGGRFHRARHHQPQDRPHGARSGRHRSAHAHQLSAHDFALLLRRRYAARAKSSSRSHNSVEEIRDFSARIRWAIFRSNRCAQRSKTPTENSAPSCYTGSYPTELVQLEVEAHRES